MYKFVQLMPIPIYCIVVIGAMIAIIHKVTKALRGNKRSQLPLYTFLLLTGAGSIALKIVLEFRPALAYSSSLAIPLMIWLLLYFAITAICLIIGYRRGEFNAMEKQQLRTLVKIIVIGVPLLGLFVGLILLLETLGILT